jgi:hypothetical protein
MRVLIGILTCKRDREYEQLIRDTWLRRCSVDYGFFLGQERTPAKATDEVILNCPDGRGIRDAVPKTKALIQYAWDNNYDYLFKCDIDTYVHVPRLLSSGFEKYDWSGYGQPYGGSGYWLSRKAMQPLLDKEIISECEDWWVAEHLIAAGFTPHQDARYHSKTRLGPQPDNDLITSHLYVDGQNIINWKERMNMIREYHSKSGE